MDIRIFQERMEENLSREVYILNPTTIEFSMTRDGVLHKIPPSSEGKFPYAIAQLLSKKIIDHIIQKKGGLIPETEKQEIIKRVRLYDETAID